MRRRMRGVAIAAVALTSAISMSACAKDSGGGNAAQNNTGSGCRYATPPAAPTTTATSTGDGEKVDASALKVGLAYDIGGRGDASYNDSAAAGLDKAAAEMGIKKENLKELTAAPNESEADKVTRLRQLATDGFSPIIAVGFAYGESLKAVAPQFPNTRFALIDASVEGASNVTPLTFAEHEGSFLAGVIAAYQSKSCTVGFIGGVDTPLIQKFEAGYFQGAKAAAPNIQIEKKYLTPAGDFTGFQDPAKGQEAAKGQIDKKADVLYHAAGASGKGVFTAAKEAGVKAIGVDSDQYNQATVANEKDVIVSSMVKRVDVAVYNLIRAVAKNDLTSLPKTFDLKVDGVGYATSGGKIDDTLKGILEGYKAQIVEGKIQVRDTP